jgi:protein-S-isoprenylcysteine O-methyltransferase Ste14
MKDQREDKMNQFVKWQNQEPSTKRQIIGLGIAALIFPTLIPALLVVVFPRVDKALGIGSLYLGTVNIVIGCLAIAIGGAVAFWTIILQITRAAGTPLPMLPTHRLLTAGPFHYCRNPMTLGTVLAYAGVAILVGSASALAVVAVFAGILIVYLKLIEEKELELRFGEEYREYKRNTPFIIPIRTRNNSSTKHRE